MPGSGDVNPGPASQATTGVPISVALLGSPNPIGGDPTGGGYQILPNVRCLQIDYREGPEPPIARFQYIMDDFIAANLGWPSQFEQLFPISAQGNYVVQTDDELVVLTQDPDGNPIVLFDGFAQIPQIDVSANHQGVTFGAIGVAIRLWDTPITFRTQRQTDKPDTVDGTADIAIQLPARFNPSSNSIGSQGGYTGNAVGAMNFTTGTVTGDYPVFIDPLIIERDDTSLWSYWYISDVVKYLCGTQPSPTDLAGNVYVNYPTFDSLDAVLGCYAADGPVINAGIVTSSNVQIRDYDATNKPFPDVISELLNYGGFVMMFATETDADGFPITTLKVARRDALSTATPKLVYLASQGQSTLDLSANNATAFHVARDCNEIINSFAVETDVKQIEITVELAPAFTPVAGDEAAGTIEQYYSANLTGASAAQRRAYRWYVADECGDGYYDVLDGMFVTDSPINLTSIFPDDVLGNKQYVNRYRPGSNKLISKDINGKPLKAILQYVLNSGGIQKPDIANAKSVDLTDPIFMTIPNGWRLLDDRLGIEITVENPEEWSTGNPKIPKISGISWLTNPVTANANSFNLLLTTVIDSDQRIPITAKKRIASPTQYSRRRSTDAKDHFQYCSVSPGSLNYKGQTGVGGELPDGTNPLIMRDDTATATTHANQLRSAHEFPKIAGSVTIPYWTDYYQIADQIQIIQGRDASFQVNIGSDQGEAPAYPWVTAFTWMFEHDKQETILQLSDRRAEPRNL